MAEWDADVDLTPEAAGALIAGQFPELSPARLQVLGVGWDNTAYQVNEEWVFRFPRRELGARLTERETRILPRLAPHLPLPVPNPVFVGKPAGDYPYVFAGYRLIPGQTACRVGWSEAARFACARPLAGFLRALHGMGVDDETLAAGPGDELERWNLRRRLPMLEERLRKLDPCLTGFPEAEVLERLTRLAEVPRSTRRPCWVHGDLYARHLLVNDARLPAGIIDWGDVHLGDPALDLSLLFSFLPAAARADFEAEYGPIDPGTRQRALARALFYGVVLTHYGHTTGDAAMRNAGRYALASSMRG